MVTAFSLKLAATLGVAGEECSEHSDDEVGEMGGGGRYYKETGRRWLESHAAL
ncbi:MAG: hypothetical protein ACI30K_00540 [Muribaculaceae bacterium]